MKLKYKFVVQKVGGKSVAVAVGQDNSKFNGMVKLNESGELIFQMLVSADYTQEEILDRFARQCGVEQDAIREDVLGFLEQLRQNDLLTE